MSVANPGGMRRMPGPLREQSRPGTNINSGPLDKGVITWSQERWQGGTFGTRPAYF